MALPRYEKTSWHLPDCYMDTLDEAKQLSIVIELAEVLARLHALPTESLSHLDVNWSAFVEERVNNCVQHRREEGVPEHWLKQIPDYLAHSMPLYPPNFIPAILSADVHHYHLLVNQECGRWRLCGLFDFDDAKIGFHEYDLASAGLFMMSGSPALLRRFFLSYGYAEKALDEILGNRLMAYTLLHRYRTLEWILKEFAKQPCSTLEKLAQAIYPLA